MMSESMVETVTADVERLMEAGQGRDAVDRLTEALDLQTDPALLERLVQLRHRAGPTHPSDAATRWPEPVPDRFEHGVVPRISASELSPSVLHAAFQHRGCLLVDGLVDHESVGCLLDALHRAVDAAAAFNGGAPTAQTTPWYVPFEPMDGYEFGAVERAFTRDLGGVLTVESPAALQALIKIFTAIGIGELLQGYFGEWPALSAKKSTLRRARPDSPTEWHQDGAFLGSSTRSVNVWLALSHCGVDAPGIDVFPEAFDRIVPTGTDDARFPWSVAPAEAARTGLGEPSRPRFAPGDALLFNQLTLHRSGIDPSMTNERYAIESWFFAPSTYPSEQIPILF